MQELWFTLPLRRRIVLSQNVIQTYFAFIEKETKVKRKQPSGPTLRCQIIKKEAEPKASNYGPHNFSY
jgi:hypothetical protein